MVATLAQFHARRWCLLALVGVVLLAACARVDPATLPGVPDVKTDKFSPGVARQLDAAFAEVRSRPGDVHANGQLAMMLQIYKQFRAADVMYQRVRALDPETFSWCYLHAVILESLGRPPDAIATYRRALELNSDYDHAKIRLAELLADRGDSYEAAQLYDEVLLAPRPSSEAYFSHGKFLLRSGQVEQAIESFNETLRQSGNLGSAYYQLGLAYREKGDKERAEHNFRLAKKHQGYSADSSDPVINSLLPFNLSEQPFVHRAKVLAENGRLDEARKYIQMALDRNPDSAQAHASMMGMAASDGDFAAVDAHFAKAVAAEPDNAKIYFNLGIARMAEKRWTDARRAFEKATELDPTAPDGFVQLAILSQREKLTMLTGRYLRKALELEPQHQLANWLYGEWLLESDRPDEASEPLKRAVADEHALRGLMYIALAKAQARSGAWADAQRSLELADDEAAFYNDSGMGVNVRTTREQLRNDHAPTPDGS